MRGHPGLGWRGSCVLLVGGLAGCAAGLHAVPVARDDTSEQRVNIVLTAGTKQPQRRAASAWPQPGRAASPHPTPASAAQPTPAHADVLAAARQFEQLGRLVEAQRSYLAVLQRYPQHVEGIHRLAVVCTRLNDFDTARAYFDRALLISPGNVSILTDAGYARYLAGDHRQAEKLLRRAIELSPKDTRATNNLAVVIGVSGRFDDALALFWQVNPPATAWTNLAYVYQLRNEPEQALTCYQHAHAADETVLVPEELLAQTTPTEPLISETELPPLPAAPARAPSKRAALAARPSHPLSEAALTTPLRFDERQPSELEALPPWPTVVPATVEPNSAIKTQIEYPVAISTAATRPQPVWTAVPLTEPEDPFELPLEVDPPAMAVEPPPVVEDAPAFVPEVEVAVPAPLAAADDTDASLFASAPVQPAAGLVEDTPPFVEEALQLAEEPQSFTEVYAPFAEEAAPFVTDEEDDPSDAAFIGSQLVQLAARAKRDGLKGFCLVTLCEERRLTDAFGAYTVEYRAQKYQFSSFAAAERFKAAPELYAPAAGGLDVVDVRQGSGVVLGSLDSACWFRDRLYMFASQKHKDEFRASPRTFLPAK